jgi:hypothetical protein
VSAATLSLCGTAFAQTTNDDYVNSAAFNSPNESLERRDSLRTPVINTRAFSLQPSLVPGGPPEPSNCNGVGYGRTAWFDFYPDIDGIVALRADMLGTPTPNPVLGLGNFRRTSPFPLQGIFQCRNENAGTREEWGFRVQRGKAYTTQVGGAGNVGGDLTLQLDFEPTRLTANSRLRAIPTPNGIQVVSLRVTSPRNAIVEVSCSRRRCRTLRARARRGRLTFRRGIAGRRLPSGTVIAIRVKRAGAIGRYLEYRVRRGSFSDQRSRCLHPASRRPGRNCG